MSRYNTTIRLKSARTSAVRLRKHLEFSALDRVLYNVVNNALRETAPDGDAIRIHISREKTPPFRHTQLPSPTH